MPLYVPQLNLSTVIQRVLGSLARRLAQGNSLKLFAKALQLERFHRERGYLLSHLLENWSCLSNEKWASNFLSEILGTFPDKCVYEIFFSRVVAQCQTGFLGVYLHTVHLIANTKHKSVCGNLAGIVHLQGIVHSPPTPSSCAQQNRWRCSRVGVIIRR